MTVNGAVTPPELDFAMTRTGFVGGTFPLRNRISQVPMAGAAAAVTVVRAFGIAAPMLPLALTRCRVMVGPTTEPEPVTRKSLPALYFAVLIEIVSVIASGVTGADAADVVSPPAFFAVTVKVKLLPDVSGLTVTV